MNGQAAVIPGKLAVSKPVRKKKISAKKKAFFSHYIGRRTLIKTGLILLVLAILVGGGFGYVQAYDGKIYPKVTVAGIKIGGDTPEQAKKVLQEKAQELNEQGPEITYNEQTLKPKLDEMGVSFNIDEAILQAYKFGRQGSFKEKILENWQILIHNHRIEIYPQIDQAKFDGYLGQLAQVAEKEPVNATLSIKGGQIILSPSEKGRGLDKEKLKKDLREFINSGKNGKIVMVTSDTEPSITEDETTDARGQAEKYMAAAPITVSFENSSWEASRAKIGSWIKFSENSGKLAASVNPSGFVSWVANQVEIPAQDREVEDGTGTVLNEGQDGRGMDTNLLSAQIKDALNSGKGASFALVTFAVPRGEKTIYPHAQPGRYASRYIDINLSEQTLYAFEGSTLVNQFLVSTGKRGYSTPTGEFAIYGKDASTLMDGPDYYLPNVPWVSWFLGDYSIHGTYWHNNFGHVMSHGCVNASISDGEWIYNWADIGTPVYVHY